MWHVGLLRLYCLRLRQPSRQHCSETSTSGQQRRPVVGVVIDGASDYGRSVLRGVLRYANLQRRWQLHEDMWSTASAPAYWPDCDGAILSSVCPTTLRYITSRTSRVVVCSGSLQPIDLPTVALDDIAAGAMAAQHLMDCRLERFAFYGASPNSVGAIRMEGFVRRLAERRFTCLQCPIEWPSGTDWITHTHRPKLVQWLRELPKPIGIMAADDQVAHDLAAACLDANIPVPEHVAIIGVNNDDLFCEGAWPPLSSIDPDFSRMGYQAAKVLDRLLAGEVLSPGERHVRLQPLGVVHRQSTSILALNDPNLVDAIRYIREHACDPCTVSDVLREVPVGRRWLERHFLRHLGRTPHDEIARVRVETARRLLLQSDLSLVDIAQQCGFSTLSNFHLAFKQFTSETPAAFRRNAVGGSGTSLCPSS